MAKKTVLFALIIIALILSAGMTYIIFQQMSRDMPPQHPFHLSVEYQTNQIFPDAITQEKMDQDVIDAFEDWATRYLEPYGADGMYVVNGYSEWLESNGYVSHSEGTGYGMLITVMMAGYNGTRPIKAYYDGVFQVYNTFKSSRGTGLMSWLVPIYGENSPMGDCATDGDMDIAYSLLLADKQWGSNGSINYKAEAVILIEKIAEYLIQVYEYNGEMHYRLNTGDAPYQIAGEFQFSTRTSDWMLGHIEAFIQIEELSTETRAKFVGLKTSILSDLIDLLEFTSTDALVPSFAYSPTASDKIKPAVNFLGGETDDDYGFDACRFPYRMAAYYAHTQDSVIGSYLMNFSVFFKQQIGPSWDMNGFKAGYYLNGTAYESWSHAAFTSPAICALIFFIENQDLLNNLWDYCNYEAQVDQYAEYYGKSLNVLAMLLISGHWWNIF